MNLLLKSLLLSLCGLILTALPLQAEDKSWYEIDGIRFRPVLANSGMAIVIYMPWKIEKRIPFCCSTRPIPGSIATTEVGQGTSMFPFAIELPETLMTSWSFGGALFEFEFQEEVKNLKPGSVKRDSDWHGSESDRTSLYDDFFNTSDKAFADANSKWTTSADVTSSNIFLGYNWGFFIPIGDYHRFFKFGAGLGVYYINLSFKLNLCSQYTSDYIQGYREGDYGECIGKKEIDSYSGQKSGIATSAQMTLWERRTKDSIWRFIKVSEGIARGSNDKGYVSVKLKNHKSLALWMSSGTIEIISYAYLF